MNEAGDVAIVNVQSKSTSTASDVRCVVNFGVAPEPWLRYEAHILGARMPKQVGASLTLWGDRLSAPSTNGSELWWRVTDETSAAAVTAEILGSLDARVLQQLDLLLDRRNFLSSVRAGDLGFFQRREVLVGMFARAEALLLMDDGPSSRLSALVEQMEATANPFQQKSTHAAIAWIRNQAAAAEATQQRSDGRA
jgi:hypothetical protein